MSLRWKLALGTAMVAVLAAGLHFFISYLGFRQAIEDEIQSELKRWSAAVAQVVVIDDRGRPRLQGGNWPWLGSGYTLGFRVKRNGRIYLEAGILPPKPTPDWATTQRPLPEGFTLELYLNVGEYRRALARQLQSGLVTLPLAAVLAAILGLFVAQRMLAPLDQLARGVEKLSHVEFPEPLPEPGGNDELAALTRSFNRMARALKEAFERERAFTRYASHELRNPLATLQAQLDALAAGVVPKEEAIAEGRRALDRMRSTLDGLLLLAREPKAELEPLPLAPLLEQAVRALPESLRQRVHLDPPPEDLWIEADERLFARALENLLNNALKHTDGQVHLRAHPEGRHVSIVVRDQGPGVPEEFLPKLTQPFFRRGQRPGLGLGLALAAQAVKAMGGTLDFQRQNPGLSARITLPRAEVDDALA